MWKVTFIMSAASVLAGLCMAAGTHAPARARPHVKLLETPGCEHESPQQCVTAALEAMGGRERLQQVTSVRLQTVGHTLLMEQSYRQSPFIASYERGHVTLDLANQRLLAETKLTWPESDPNQSDSDTTLVAGPDGGVYHTTFGDSPCSLADLDASREALALVALGASLAHRGRRDRLAPTRHRRICVRPSTRWWPSAGGISRSEYCSIRSTICPTPWRQLRYFHDFWYYWGDVQQRIYFDKLEAGRGDFLSHELGGRAQRAPSGVRSQACALMWN